MGCVAYYTQSTFTRYRLSIRCYVLESGMAALISEASEQLYVSNQQDFNVSTVSFTVFEWDIGSYTRPVSLNAIARLLTTLTNVYTSKWGDWSIITIATIVITSLVLASSLSVLMVYKFKKLKDVVQEDEIETQISVCHYHPVAPYWLDHIALYSLSYCPRVLYLT